jgi:hypothetical protein
VNFYDRWILPVVLDLAMRQQQLSKYRREVVAAAQGRVLEVGIGSGLNFSYYGKQVEIVLGLDLPRNFSPKRVDVPRLPAFRPSSSKGRRPQFRSGVTLSTP